MDLLTVLTVVRMNSVTVSAVSVSKGHGGKPFRLHDRRTVSTAAVRQYIRPGDCHPTNNLSIDDLLTVVTVQTVVQIGYVRDVLRRMIRVPARPSRPKLISIPSA